MPADANRHGLYVIEEGTYNTTPTAPAFDVLRNTGCTLALSKDTFMSEELRPDRQIADYRHGNKQVGGAISFELSYGTFDKLLKAALQSEAWAAKDGTPLEADTISASSTDNSFNDSADGFTYEVGDFIDVDGFTTPANNGRFQIISATASKIIVANAEQKGSNLTTEAAGDDVTIDLPAEVIKCGTTRKSLSIMRHFADLEAADEPFHLFKGVELNNFEMTVQPGGIVKASMTALGKSFSLGQTAPASTTYNDATTTRVFDSFSGKVFEGNTLLSICTELKFTLENGMKAEYVIGSDETERPSNGKSNLNGSATMFFRNSTMLRKFIDETPSSLIFTLKDKAGNIYIFRFPNICYNGGQPDTSGEGPITLAMPFQALLDEALAAQFSIERIPAAA